MIGDVIVEPVKLRRLELGIAARELVWRIGLSAYLIGQLEGGKTNVVLESLRLIAEQFSVSILHFLSDASQIPEPQISQITMSPKFLRCRQVAIIFQNYWEADENRNNN